MSTLDGHPYVPTQAFFAKVAIARGPQVAGPELEVAMQANVVSKALPDKLEVRLRVNTTEERSLNIDLILIGNFVLVDGVASPDQEEIYEYVENVGLPVMWAYVDQMVRAVTAQMGMHPVSLPAPTEFPRIESRQNQVL